jgi:hypothetical protein
LQVGLAGAGERLDRRVGDRGIQVGARGVTGTRCVDRGVRIAQHGHDRAAVVEVDHRRCGAAVGEDLGL